jgi:glycosyl transferase family 25
MNSLKYKIFVINMPKSKERWEYINSQIQNFNLSCERIDGVDISTLSQAELDRYYSYKKNRKDYPRALTKGEIGCYIAHIKCWEEIIKQNLDFGIILEDDITFDDKFPQAIEFIKKYFDKWDFIRLQVETKSRLLYQKQDFEGFSIYEFIRNSGCMWGYALNKRTAETLIDNLLPFGITADSNMHVYYEFGVDVKTLIPPVIFMRNNNDSDIDEFGSRKKQRNFYPFARQIFSIKAYCGRMFQLIKRDGLFKSLPKIIMAKKIKPEATIR